MEGPESILSVSSPLTSSFADEVFNVNSNTTTTPSEYEGLPLGIQILMYFLYILITVTAVGGNGIVCFLVFRYPKMRTVTNFFIVNLAIGDILMACLCIPFTFVSNLLLQYWPFGSVMCILVSYSQAVSVFISAYTLIAISIDRYIAIINPLRPRMTKLQAKMIIAGVWVVALLTPLPTALLSQLIVPEGWSSSSDSEESMETKSICTEVWTENEQRYWFSMALMILQYIFPLTVLIYTYARIARVVWGKQTPGEAEDSRDRKMAASKRKMVKMMITCVMAFTLCWLPFNALLVIGDQYPDIYLFSHINYVWFACHFLAMSHACYNPFIYVWMNSRFHSGFCYIFGRLLPFCCGNRFSEDTPLPDFIPHPHHTVLHSQQHTQHQHLLHQFNNNNSQCSTHNQRHSITRNGNDNSHYHHSKDSDNMTTSLTNTSLLRTGVNGSARKTNLNLTRSTPQSKKTLKVIVESDDSPIGSRVCDVEVSDDPSSEPDSSLFLQGVMAKNSYHHEDDDSFIIRNKNNFTLTPDTPEKELSQQPCIRVDHNIESKKNLSRGSNNDNIHDES